MRIMEFEVNNKWHGVLYAYIYIYVSNNGYNNKYYEIKWN